MSIKLLKLRGLLNFRGLGLEPHYRDRGDAENNFDELKNQWGWAGFTTQDRKRCQIMGRIMALVYNWWTIFMRLEFRTSTPKR